MYMPLFFLASLHNVAIFSTEQIIPVPSEVPDIFVTVFNHSWGEAVQGEGKEVWLELQLAVLHMTGAILSSSMVCIE